MAKKTVLVLYYTRGVYPLRNAIKTHLYSWKNYSKHNVLYINVAFGFPEKLVNQIKIDVIVFHTIFLSMRWSPDIFKTYTEKCASIKDLDCIKVAVPQDEFINTELLNDFLCAYKITHLFTCAYEQDWQKIYPKLDFNKVKIKQVLTGYLDKATVDKINKKKRIAKGQLRNIDFGYRAWKAEYWLGEHGLHKVKVANVFQDLANRHPIKVDISLRNEDVLAGDDWFDFLLKCKATIGVEGGASVLDSRGEIKKRVDAYLKDYPSASFEEARAACFPTEDNQLSLFCISPRHLEACITETCQFLIEGSYSDILKPWQHYVPIAKDYSNVEEVLQVLNDDDKMKRITKNAYQDVVATQKWTYEYFINDFDLIVVNEVRNSLRKPYIQEKLADFCIRLREYRNWWFIRFEVWYLKQKKKTKFLTKFYSYFLKIIS